MNPYLWPSRQLADGLNHCQHGLCLDPQIMITSLSEQKLARMEFALNGEARKLGQCEAGLNYALGYR